MVMTFKEFSEKTNKVHVDLPDMPAKYNFKQLPHNPVKLACGLWGYYTPNELNIRNLCNSFIIHNDLNNFTNGSMIEDEFFAENFMQMFYGLINEPHLYEKAEIFADAKKFVKSKGQAGLARNGHVNELIGLFGKIYESQEVKYLGLLENDIRLDAMSALSKINFIGNIEVLNKGYAGVGYIAPEYKNDKNFIP